MHGMGEQWRFDELGQSGRVIGYGSLDSRSRVSHQDIDIDCMDRAWHARASSPT